jgi:ATP-dependent Clp protease ATP-binding subunit ClpB
VDIQIKYLNERLAEKNMGLELTEKAKELIATYGYDPTFGARPLKRAIQRHIENPLALKILDGTFVEGDKIIVDVNDFGEFVFTKQPVH